MHIWVFTLLFTIILFKKSCNKKKHNCLNVSQNMGKIPGKTKYMIFVPHTNQGQYNSNLKCKKLDSKNV